VSKLETVHYCEAFARKGTGYGACNRPLDKDGYCDNARDHVEDAPREPIKKYPLPVGDN
jgi:hypothetical protein